jgi:hypothetical protein
VSVFRQLTDSRSMWPGRWIGMAIEPPLAARARAVVKAEVPTKLHGNAYGCQPIELIDRSRTAS